MDGLGGSDGWIRWMDQMDGWIRWMDGSDGWMYQMNGSDVDQVDEMDG